MHSYSLEIQLHHIMLSSDKVLRLEDIVVQQMHVLLWTSMCLNLLSTIQYNVDDDKEWLGASRVHSEKSWDDLSSTRL